MKKINYFYKIILILSFINLLLNCQSKHSFQENSINGLIYDANNEPVSGASLFLNNKINCISDIYGHFTILGPDLNTKYKLKVEKEGFETTEIDFEYLNQSQMIYIRISSISQLLSETETYLKQGNNDKSKKILNRISNIDENNYSALYLKAIIEYKEKKYDESINILENLLLRKKEAYVYLLLADNFQYGLNDKEKAKQYLKDFLKISFNQNVEERYLSL